MATHTRTCPTCHSVVARNAIGRPRRFCDTACRNKHYDAKRRETARQNERDLVKARALLADLALSSGFVVLSDEHGHLRLRDAVASDTGIAGFVVE